MSQLPTGAAVRVKSPRQYAGQTAEVRFHLTAVSASTGQPWYEVQLSTGQRLLLAGSALEAIKP